MTNFLISTQFDPLRRRLMYKNNAIFIINLINWDAFKLAHLSEGERRVKHQKDEKNVNFELNSRERDSIN